MVEEYRIRYCLFLTAIMIASDSWLNLFKNDFKVKTVLQRSEILAFGNRISLIYLRKCFYC